jgi:hypothetical protein
MPYLPAHLRTRSRAKTWDQFSEKERRFVDEYCTNGYDTLKAWDAAGYSMKCTPQNRRTNANQVMRRPHIRAEVDRRLHDVIMSNDEALARHSQVGRADVGDCFTDEPLTCPECGHEMEHEGPLRLDMKKVRALGLTSLIKKVTTAKDGRQTVEFYAADDARRDILKAGGAFRTREGEAASTLLSLVAAAAAESKKKAAPIEDAEVVVPYDADDASFEDVDA